MGMPRFYRGAPASASALNVMAQELDDQGRAAKVRTTTSATLSPNTDYIIGWSAEDYDTQGGGMWDPTAPAYVQINVAGVYLCKAQLRFGTFGNGEAAGKLLLNTTNVNSTDPVNGPKASDKRGFSTSGEGVTLNLIAVEPLYPGDRVYTNVWHSSSAAMGALYQNFGGTYLSVSRLSQIT